MFLFGNWAEWAGHRYLLHSPKSWIKPAYKRHVATHHQFFSHKTLDYNGHKEWRALLFPPFAPVLFVLAALPAALLIGNLWSANAGYIAMLTMASYFLMYEGLHTLSHLEHPILDRLPLVNTVRRMHVLHHNPDFMHTRNFNLTFPICDALFGTSVATGRFNADATADVAVGEPGRDMSPGTNNGAWSLYFGQPDEMFRNGFE